MLKSYKYRLYPNKSQSELLNKHFGCCRFIYNWALNKRIEYYKETGKTLKSYDIIREITTLKKQPETEWLKEVTHASLNQAVLHMESAYNRFFREKRGYPKFKSKNKSKNSYSLPIRVKIKNREIQIPKLGLLKTRPFPYIVDKIRTCTISKTSTGKYFISILTQNNQELPKTKPISVNNSIGIDTGIKNFVVLSNGKVFDNPQYLRTSLDRIKILSKRLSKKEKGSKNRVKARLRLAKAYEKVANQRLDYIHKVTHELTKGENQADSIFIEDLNIQGMLANRRLALSLQDSSLGEFYRILEYKCKWYGVNLIKIGRFEPSSKLCTCGYKNDELKLSDRSWTCKHCGTTHDRDLLASQNIKKIGLEKYSGAGSPVEPVEVSTLGEPMKQEFLLIN